MSAKVPLRYCGRQFTAEEIDLIRELIASEAKPHRAELSRVVCDELGWLCANGRRKDMSCRVAMLRMEKDGLITLPPPLTVNGNGRNRPGITPHSDPREPLTLPAGALGPLLFRAVHTPKSSSLWNEMIERYHYLGYKPLPGQQMRYLVFAGIHLVALLGFGAAAWKVAPRDLYIGWTPQQRERNLHLIVNNARFLILPWVTSRNLASRILAGVAKILPSHWENRYNCRPVLLETFVQKDLFAGTCYRAANWIHLGVSQGRGKCDKQHRFPVPVKNILIYPLHKNFSHILKSEK